jgi:hypothetical protein
MVPQNNIEGYCIITKIIGFLQFFYKIVATFGKFDMYKNWALELY